MSLYSLDIGKGKPVIFIHGFCESSEVWSDFVKPLEHKYRILIPDLPGFGKSALPEKVSLNGVAQLLWEWCAEMKVAQPVIVGHSLGGYVALGMAGLNPGGLSGLVLFHSTALPDSEEKKENRTKVYHLVEKNGTAPFLEGFISGLFFKKEPQLLQRYHTWAQSTLSDTILKYTLAMRDRPSHIPVIQEFDAPLLFIAGRHDALIPVESLQKQAALAKRSELAIVDDTGHMGMMENPDACMESLLGFLNQF